MGTLVFILEILLIAALAVLAAILAEKIIAGKTGESLTGITTNKITMIGVFSAVSGVLMLIEIPLWFAPPFYKLDISELPVLILTFAYGPVSGVLCEMIKVFLKTVLKGTDSAYVGELANFIIGCSFLLPAGICYRLRKTKKQAGTGCILGTAVMTVFGSLFNGIYLLPKFAVLYGTPLDNIVAMGTAVNSAVNSVTMLVLCCVVPLNLIKGTLDSVLTMLLYKRLSPILKGTRNAELKPERREKEK